MIFEPSREAVRRFFCEAWRKHLERSPLEALEAIAVEWIAQHPEYHQDLASLDTALATDYPVDAGRTNPFLHLAMHLSVAEQVQIDQPPGIRAAHEALARRLDSAHEAAHRIMECLGEILWRAQRERREPDGPAYLECILKQCG